VQQVVAFLWAGDGGRGALRHRVGELLAVGAPEVVDMQVHHNSAGVRDRLTVADTTPLEVLNGEDLNQRPDSSASRWIVDFADRPLEVSKTYVHPFDHVVENVRPERVKGPRKAYRDRWWQFAEKQMSMRRAIAQLPEVLVIALVSKTVMPMRVPTGQIFSHALGVFATDDYGDQAVLSSNLHQLWAITYGSGMRNDPRYTPSDVFETFPRPAQQ